MVMNRRAFLGGAGAALLTGLCYPVRVAAEPVARGVPVGNGLECLRAMRDLPGRREFMLGYPVNMNYPSDGFFDWRDELSRVGLNRFAFNNVGDPFEHGHFPFNSHALEREVVEKFAALYAFPRGNMWGFISNSGTDSNMHGMYMGRTVLQGRTGRVPKVYFTTEAHYSVQILTDLLGLEWVPVTTHADGRMHEQDLARCLDENADAPALVVPTIGTTFRGAVDSIDAINAVLRGREAYVHLDAALFGGYLPHTAFAEELHQQVDGKGRYDSIAVSCHKFFGFLSPAGIFVSTREAFEEFHRRFSEVHDPEYILQVPGTITCSRDAVKSAEFHYYATEDSLKEQRDDAGKMLANAAYLLEQMESRFPEMRPVRANAMSNTVYFRRPSEKIVDEYVLATMDVQRDAGKEPHAHVVVMPHAGRRILDRFLTDLERYG